MADNTRIDDVEAVDTGGETEPATKHDVTEGGVLGAVGGAVVGGLAGGPIGAVIGAVVGGVAAAGAVDVVDKRDHDYADTSHSDAIPEGDGSDSVLLPATGAAAPVSPMETPERVPADLTHRIQVRAYEIYEQRGRYDGRDVEDWLEAEREFVKI